MSCQESGTESRRDKHDISCIWADNIRLAHLSDKRGRAAVFRSTRARPWDEWKCFHSLRVSRRPPLHLAAVVSRCRTTPALKEAIARWGGDINPAAVIRLISRGNKLKNSRPRDAAAL